QRKVTRDPPLDAEIVLIDVGISEIRIFRIESQQPACRRSGTLSAKVRNQGNGLIEPGSPRELSGLGDVGSLHRCESVRSVQPHIRGDIVEDFVISHAKTKT